MKQLEFTKVYAWAAAHLGGMCSPKTAVFSIIYSYHEAEKNCYISYKTFAKRIGVTERTIQTAIKQLESEKVIYSGWSNYTNTKEYEVNDRIVSQWIYEFQNEILKRDNATYELEERAF